MAQARQRRNCGMPLRFADSIDEEHKPFKKPEQSIYDEGNTLARGKFLLAFAEESEDVSDGNSSALAEILKEKVRTISLLFS